MAKNIFGASNNISTNDIMLPNCKYSKSQKMAIYGIKLTNGSGIQI